MDNIGDIVKSVIGNIANKKAAATVDIEKIWGVVIGGEEKEHTCLVGINNGVLFIYVDSSAWLYHFRVKKDYILKKIKDRIPEIKDIHFKIGKIR